MITFNALKNTLPIIAKPKILQMKTRLYALLVMMAVSSASGLFAQTFTVGLKAFLEGPFNGSEMNAMLNSFNYLPLAQPYNIAPWNYQGTESVVAIPNANVVDWVLVELRETAGDASTAYEGDSISSKAGFILKNGNIVATDGVSPLQFTCTVSYKLYAVIYHRNHLAVLSGNELVNTAGNYTYNFTAGANQAYGGSNAHKEITPGIWGLVSGDGDANGQVNNADKNDIWKPQSGNSGYKAGDFNMNGQVDNVDKNDYWKVNSGKSSQMPGSWACGKSISDNRDGQIYSTVQIGTQCWMRQNLNIGTMIPGNTAQTDNAVIEKYCYSDIAANCDEYGGLYQWEEMMQYVTTPGAKGICPDGWHLPTDAEWCTLEQYVDPTISCTATSWRGIDGGGKLKEAGTAHWAEPNSGATNTSGFTALPGGMRLTNGTFDFLTHYGIFWSSSDISYYGWFRYLFHISEQSYRDTDHKNNGYSVRCLKGIYNQPPAVPSNPNPPNNSTNQQINTQLSWTCTDPENDPLTYDLYFGNGNPPAQVAAGLTGTTYNPGTLAANTTYYWKIVAHDDHDNTTEGPVWSFTTEPWQCGLPFTDMRDNQEYITVQIGTQCWMAENLNVGTWINTSINQTNNGILEKYCNSNLESNCNIYGGLYQWNEAMQYSTTPGVTGICPTGWHLPADEEWTTLTDYVNNQLSYQCNSTSGWIAKAMAATTLWNNSTATCAIGNNLSLNNATGFSGLPGGWSSGSVGWHCYWWSSSTLPSSIYAWRWRLHSAYPDVNRDISSKVGGLSVRCVKYPANQPPAQPSNPNPPNNSTNQQINTQLSWTCTDPENDPLTYDVYFGTVNPPPQVTTGQTGTTYNPGTLNYSTTYYWKVVAHDDHGNTTEGQVWSFTTEPQPWQCGNTFIDPRDNQVYTTVQIGTQCWMAENLDIGTMINGSTNQTDNGAIEKYCYDNNMANCDVYGGLYQWDEMMQYVATPGGKGICIDGWHLPTDAEWCILEQFVDPTITCSSLGWRGIDGGGKLKETGTLHWLAPNYGATNSSGFTALPGGYRKPDGSFYGLASDAWFGSSSESGANAWFRRLAYEYAIIYRSSNTKDYGRSVRCLHD